jgi:hypothetical protein
MVKKMRKYSIRIKNELWFSVSRGGSPLGYFDDIALLEGECKNIVINI